MTTKCAYYRYWGKAADIDDKTAQYHLLPYHSLDVAAVGQLVLSSHKALTKALAESLALPEPVFSSWAVYFLALHDLGKFAESFQGLRGDLFEHFHHRPACNTYNMRHDSLGHQLWKQNLSAQFLKANPLKMSSDSMADVMPAFDIWMSAMTGHHGQPPINKKLQLKNDFSNNDIEAAEQFAYDLSFLLTEATPDDIEPEYFYEAVKSCSWWLAGLGVLCDWLGSNRSIFKYEDRSDFSLQEYWERALKSAETAIEQAGIKPVCVGPQKRIDELFDYVVSATPLQEQASEMKLADEPQLLILEDRTGSGKTEAALLLAHRLMRQGQADGVYFGLPTMATANAMYQRVSQVHAALYEQPGKASLVLAHGRRKFVDAFANTLFMPSPPPEANLHVENEESASARCTAWLADNTKKALLASNGVGTIDQALMAILATKHQSLRLIGLFRKVLIVDEVHACDAYMHSLLCTLLEFHAAAGGSAILLSATLPQAMRADLCRAFATGRNNIENPPEPRSHEYPLLTHCLTQSLQEYPVASDLAADRRVRIKLIHIPESAERLVTKAIAAEQSVCWIRNTVRDACESYNRLAETHPDCVDLFHARYTLGDRLDREELVLDRFGKNADVTKRQGRVLIATQVVEQSLDLDFDIMISDLAPIDLLIQRAGRLHRHIRDQQGNLKSKGPDERGEPCLYVLSPDPDVVVDDKWVSQPLPGTGAVYRRQHTQLWRTARLLKDTGEIAIPSDSRRLIESVFSDAGPTIPPELEAANQRGLGEDQADRSIADFNELNIGEGYRATSKQWRSETSAPTRLGEPTTQLCLLRWTGSTLEPLYEGKTDYRWQLSQLSIRRSLVANQSPSRTELDAALIALTERLPFLKKWLVLVPMMPCNECQWRGHALDAKDRSVRIDYDTHKGLSVVRLEKQ